MGSSSSSSAVAEVAGTARAVVTGYASWSSVFHSSSRWLCVSVKSVWVSVGKERGEREMCEEWRREKKRKKKKERATSQTDDLVRADDPRGAKGGGAHETPEDHEVAAGREAGVAGGAEREDGRAGAVVERRGAVAVDGADGGAPRLEPHVRAVARGRVRRDREAPALRRGRVRLRARVEQPRADLGVRGRARSVAHARAHACTHAAQSETVRVRTACVARSTRTAVPVRAKSGTSTRRTRACVCGSSATRVANAGWFPAK